MKLTITKLLLYLLKKVNKNVEYVALPKGKGTLYTLSNIHTLWHVK